MLNVNSFRKMKDKGEKIVMITCYDALCGFIADKMGIDLILVGDSMANTVLGYKNTTSLSIEESIFHTKAVRRGAPEAFIIADMPFMTYQNRSCDALSNAARYIQECDANAIKLEGGSPENIALIEKMTSCGIPVVGHIGLLPQKILTSGSYKVVGKSEIEIERLISEAKAIQNAGAFMIVLECMPAQTAKLITQELEIPTVGIGAGIDCDGQVQVITDVLGLGNFVPKHAKRYACLNDSIENAIASYIDDVKKGEFPRIENSF